MNQHVALVTGGAAGIGQAHVTALLAEGAKVCFVDVQTERGRDLEQELSTKYGEENVVFVDCDVSNPDRIRDVFDVIEKKFGRLDTIINNAGIINEGCFHKTIQINLLGTIEVCQQGIAYMGTHRGGKGGVIVNTSSLAALRPFAAAPMYTASKFGVLGYTLALGAISQALYGIRINAVCPGRVQTDLLDMSGKTIDENLYTEYCEKHAQQTPLRPEDVTACVLRLIKDDCLSGRAVWCMPGYPTTLLNMPSSTCSIQDVIDTFVNDA